MSMSGRRVAVILFLVSSLAGCAAFEHMGAEQMRAVATDNLCYWRGNPISGQQMKRELARRGEDCTPHSKGPLAEPPVALMPLPSNGPPDVARPSIPTTTAVQAEQEAANARRTEAHTSPGAAPTRSAPLVTSACAERMVRRGGEEALRPQTRTVMFSNRCDFPIKVLYASDSSKNLSVLTELLQPGQASKVARLEDGFDFPGYVVCSYAASPVSLPCRVSSRGG